MTHIPIVVKIRKYLNYILDYREKCLILQRFLITYIDGGFLLLNILPDLK